MTHRKDTPGLDDDLAFPRPNHLALAGFIVSTFTLMGQTLAMCTFYCAGPLFAIPTLLGLVLAMYGWHQAKRTGVGGDLAAAGIAIGVVNLGIALIWVMFVVCWGGALGLCGLIANWK